MGVITLALGLCWKSSWDENLVDNQNMALVNTLFYLNFMACACAQKQMTLIYWQANLWQCHEILIFDYFDFLSGQCHCGNDSKNLQRSWWVRAIVSWMKISVRSHTSCQVVNMHIVAFGHQHTDSMLEYIRPSISASIIINLLYTCLPANHTLQLTDYYSRVLAGAYEHYMYIAVHKLLVLVN